MSDEAEDPLDAELAKARGGDRHALGVLVRSHQRSVYSLALRMLGTRHLAEDLTQDVFMQLQGKLTAIASNRHLGFWLRQVTANRAIDQLRRGSRLQMTSLDEQPQLFNMESDADPLLQRHLRKLLDELTPPARAVLLLRYQEDLDPVDIARTLGMSINTVKSHLKRALDSLRGRAIGMQLIRCEDNRA